MKKNPLLILLAISGSLFALFLVFIFFAFGMIFSEEESFIALGTKKERVGVLPIDGVILNSKEVLENIKEFAEDPKIKGVIVRVNSPGGAVAPSQEIYHALLRLREEKPVIASFDSIAASGGYYIGAAANKIVANEGTITGSIGVIMQFMNLAELYDWAKVKRIHITSGKFKDTGTDIRDMRPEERQLLQTMVDDVHQQFVSAIVEGRNMRKNTVKALADGRIFSGKQAKEAGLVDELGGLKKAVGLMQEVAGLQAEPKLVYPEKKKQRFFLELFSTKWAGQALQNLLSGFFNKAPLRSGLYFLAPAYF